MRAMSGTLGVNLTRTGVSGTASTTAAVIDATAASSLPMSAPYPADAWGHE